MSDLKYFLDKARKISWLGVEFILKGGFPKGKWIPFSDLHRQIQETIDKVKKEVEAVKLGLLDPNRAKRGALIQTARDHSKCSVKGTLITLENGLQKPIEKCQVGDKVLAINESLQFVPAKIINVIDNGIEDVYEVKLASGKKVIVTDNHPFFTVNGWKSIRDGLKEGERVAVSRYIPRINVKKHFSDNQLKILAYLIAEGTTTSRRYIYFSNSKKEIVNDLNLALKEEFGLSLKLMCRNDYVVVGNGRMFCKKDFINFLDKYGLLGKYSYNKTIPQELFYAPENDIRLFLRCLWLCDGSIRTEKRRKKVTNGTWIEYSTSSEKLAYQIQTLLEFLGIVSRIYPKKTKKRTNYCVYVLDKNSKLRFLDLILDKKIDGEDILEKVKNSAVSAHFNVPRELIVSCLEHSISWFRNYGIRINNKYNITYDKIRRLYELEPDNICLQKILNSHIWWDRVVSIEYKGKEKTYGLEVDKYHNHITNGIVTHNTTSVLGRVLWELGNNPNLLVKIVCASEEQAKKRIAFLRRHIETNKNLHLLFPHLKPQPDSAWSTTQLYVERDLISPDPSVEAAGVLGSFTGSHCVVEGTPIITSEGLKPIEEVKVGDYVYSITGDFQKVIATAKHFYEGEICSIQSVLDDYLPTIITSNHKVFVRYVKDDVARMTWKEIKDVVREPEKYQFCFPKPSIDLDFWEDLCSLKADGNALFYYFPVKNIEVQYYEGIVYDLQVDKTESFCSPFLILKNCNLVVFDDIVDFRNAFVYPENLKKIEQAVKENWLNILSEDGYFVAIYTAWTKDDITLKMEKQTDLYYVFKRVIDDDLNPIWEAKYNREALIRKREEIGEEAFARQFQGKIVVDRSNLFNKQSIEACKDPNIEFGEYPDNCLFFTGVDLGHRKRDKSPRTVIFTLAVTEDGKRLPVSIVAGNFSPTETGQLIINEFLKYNPEVIKVENNGYQESILDIISLIDPSLSLPVEGCFTGSQKNDIRVGLPSLATEFDRKLWIIPAKNLDQHPPHCDCGLCLWLRELESYPHGLTDTVMASWFALQGVRQVLGTDTAYNVRVVEYNGEDETITIS